MARAGARPPLRDGNPGTLPNTKVPYRTAADEQVAREAAAEAQLQVWRRHLPALFKNSPALRIPAAQGVCGIN